MSIGDLNHFVISAVVLTLTAGFVEASPKLNIVVFLTDDQGYGDLGCFGSESLETPNIDRLCQQGMKFTDFYVHQRCSPTRIDGRNILPYMKGEEVTKAIHESFIVPDSVIRHGHWKLLVRELNPGGKSGREGKRPLAPAESLFNLQADPGETRDVSADHPKVVADLRRRMDDAVRELEANSRPIGRLPGTPVPATKKKDKH